MSVGQPKVNIGNSGIVQDSMGCCGMCGSGFAVIVTLLRNTGWLNPV